jgi:hypothetical protein
MMVRLATTDEDAERWQQYVERTPECSHYHRWGWKRVIENSFGWPTYFLMAEASGEALGVLPLVLQSSRIFGSFLTSLPFLNGAGPAAKDAAVEDALVQEAVRLAGELGVGHLELRYRRAPRAQGLHTKTNKVAPSQGPH